MAQLNTLIAIYRSQDAVAKCVAELQRAGIDTRSLSVAAKEAETDDSLTGHYRLEGSGMQYLGTGGEMWDNLWRRLSGSAFFSVPGMGKLLVAGPLVAWIVESLDGPSVAEGMSPIAAAFAGIGIPTDRVASCEAALRSCNFVLLVNGSASAVGRAREIVDTTRPFSVAWHVVPLVESASG